MSVERRKLYWKYRTKIVTKYRLFTSEDRVLPNFLIIGAQKSGTTSLYSYLSQHPEIKRSYEKEVHFFDGGVDPSEDSFAKGDRWYRSHFPLQRDISEGQKVFEASPLYLFNPLAPRRIYDLIPEVKLIAVLRNPVDRAISHYFHEQRLHRESLPIMEALQIEEERLKPSLEKQDYKSHNYIHYSYKSRGRYHEQLKRYFEIFPRKNILLLNSKHLFTDLDGSLEKVCEFVGVAPAYRTKNASPRNVGTNRTNIPPDVYEYLDNYFRPYNRQLCEMIGESYEW